MSSALYRKYRPQKFADMIGQNHIKITLQHELERDEIAHAYLFCGPRGLGKTTSARLFAKAVNCANRKAGESEPCNECESCLDIMAGRAVDIIEIDAASNTGVDNVRENIIENSRFNPVRSKFKVFIIDEVHMLSASAFNALLKIMEEPPEHVIFILCTTEIHKLPLTIISRCQRFDFKKVTGEQLITRLEMVVKGESKKVDNEVLKRIVVSAEGCVRDAESLLAKVLSLGDDISIGQADIVLPRSDYERIGSFVGYLSEKNAAAAIESINRLIDEGFDLAVFADNLMEFLRQMLLVKTSGELETYGVELSSEADQSVKELAQKFNWAELLEMIEIFSDKSKEIKRSAIYQLPLEIAVIMLTQKIARKPESTAFSAAGNQNNQIFKRAPDAAKASMPASPISEPSNSPVQQPILSGIKPAQIQAGAETKAERSAALESGSSDTDDAGKSEGSAATVEVETAAETAGGLDLDAVIAVWPIVVQKLMKSNFTLGQLLRMGQPLSFSNNRLAIAVTTAFFQGRLEASNNRPVIEQVFAEELGAKVIISGVVSASIEPIKVDIDYGDADEAESAPVSPFAAASLSPVEDALNMF